VLSHDRVAYPDHAVVVPSSIRASRLCDVDAPHRAKASGNRSNEEGVAKKVLTSDNSIGLRYEDVS